MQGCLEDEYARTPERKAAWRTVGRRRIGPRPESARRGLPLSPGPPRAAAAKRGCARRPRRLDPDALGFQPPLVSSRSWFPAALGFQPRWPDTRCRAGSGARLALSKKCEGVTHATVPTSCFDPAGRKHTEPTIRSERAPPATRAGPGRLLTGRLVRGAGSGPRPREPTPSSAGPALRPRVRPGPEPPDTPTRSRSNRRTPERSRASARGRRTTGRPNPGRGGGTAGWVGGWVGAARERGRREGSRGGWW